MDLARQCAHALEWVRGIYDPGRPRRQLPPILVEGLIFGVMENVCEWNGSSRQKAHPTLSVYGALLRYVNVVSRRPLINFKTPIHFGAIHYGFDDHFLAFLRGQQKGRSEGHMDAF